MYSYRTLLDGMGFQTRHIGAVVVGPAHFKTVVPLMRVSYGTRISKEGLSFFLSLELSTPPPPTPVTYFFRSSSFFVLFMAVRRVVYVLASRRVEGVETISNYWKICDNIWYYSLKKSKNCALE